MSVKSLFTDDQWFLLSSTPGIVGAAMSNAAPSGIFGTMKEISVAMRTTVQGKERFPDSELIQELMRQASNWEEAKEKMTDYRERTKTRLERSKVKNREALQSIALQDCEAALLLVDEYCSEKDAATYREWTLNIATSVAEAAKEGGILGIGGELVSEKERNFLNQLENTLGVQLSVLMA